MGSAPRSRLTFWLLALDASSPVCRFNTPCVAAGCPSGYLIPLTALWLGSVMLHPKATKCATRPNAAIVENKLRQRVKVTLQMSGESSERREQIAMSANNLSDSGRVSKKERSGKCQCFVYLVACDKWLVIQILQRFKCWVISIKIIKY